MATIGTKIFTFIFGKKVGNDSFGNKYYKSSPTLGKYVGKYNKERRWVIFNGKNEASKIPPEWHGWIHYNTDIVPDYSKLEKQKWQKEYTPNLTGTDLKYLPTGHKKKGGIRDKATGDYIPWEPK
jgi:NADH:ubiquinone oxidoreductase subunit